MFEFSNLILYSKSYYRYTNYICEISKEGMLFLFPDFKMLLRKINSRFHSNFVQNKYSSLHILSRNHYKIACPLAITFLILYTRSSDNQVYSAIYIPLRYRDI